MRRLNRLSGGIKAKQDPQILFRGRSPIQALLPAEEKKFPAAGSEKGGRVARGVG